MPDYVCMIYDKDDKVISVENFDGLDDHGAAIVAASLTTRFPHSRGFELWSGGQKIASSLPKVGGPLKLPEKSRD